MYKLGCVQERGHASAIEGLELAGGNYIGMLRKTRKAARPVDVGALKGRESTEERE